MHLRGLRSKTRMTSHYTMTSLLLTKVGQRMNVWKLRSLSRLLTQSMMTRRAREEPGSVNYGSPCPACPRKKTKECFSWAGNGRDLEYWSVVVIWHRITQVRTSGRIRKPLREDNFSPWRRIKLEIMLILFCISFRLICNRWNIS